MERKYLQRIADNLLDTALQVAGAVLIEGPKWCGKTRTAKERAASFLFMQDPDHTASYLTAADTKPSLLLRGEVPRLIDEWQLAPVLWDAVRFAVDERGVTGQFIMTGSAVPTDNALRHTGTGRISRLKDGRWGAVEIKLGAKAIDVAAANLIKLREKVNLDKMMAPSFLMVLTGTQLAYRRKDGVNVVPIGCLKN